MYGDRRSQEQEKQLQAWTIKLILRGLLDLHVETFIRWLYIRDAKQEGKGKDVKLRVICTCIAVKAKGEDELSKVGKDKKK